MLHHTIELASVMHLQALKILNHLLFGERHPAHSPPNAPAPAPDHGVDDDTSGSGGLQEDLSSFLPPSGYGLGLKVSTARHSCHRN